MNLHRFSLISSMACRSLQRKTPCNIRVNIRSFRYSAAQRVEVPNFMGFLSNTENDKVQDVTKEVSKQQVLDDDEEDDMEEMFIMGPSQGQIEWGGPTRGGQRPEPTRFGDWERKGRVTDF
mmetsp:Transcript_1411/g.2722  ORF Transcript_1411/g.2722 Transcript_1411/m.2722 type:complete len:121 (-) Transcript_1411:83-445(-)